MIDGRGFEERLFAWLDGELPPAEAAEMEAYCVAHPDARARVAAERAFDDRVKKALLSDAGGREMVLAALAKAQAAGDGATPAIKASPAPSSPGVRPSVAAPSSAAPRRGRLHRLPRWMTGAAAAAVLAVAAMWVNCIPPFECGYLQALEAASFAPASGPLEYDGLGGERVPIVLTGCCEVWRAHVPVAGGEATLMFCPDPANEPSFRRVRRIDGDRWWIGFEDGRTLVAFPEAEGRGLWCFVGTQDEATLIGAARRFRKERSRAPK